VTQKTTLSQHGKKAWCLTIELSPFPVNHKSPMNSNVKSSWSQPQSWVYCLRVCALSAEWTGQKSWEQHRRILLEPRAVDGKYPEFQNAEYREGYDVSFSVKLLARGKISKQKHEINYVYGIPVIY
jgi:hypothetical protein